MLIDKTITALKRIVTQRYFLTERGFVTEFYCQLNRQIEIGVDFPNYTILEVEVQKRRGLHYGLTQRPDLIVHIPIETGLTDNANENNFAVYAFKLGGGSSKVQEDFSKLDEMFYNLNYQIGFFINIGAFPNIFLETYEGIYKDQIHEFSIGLDNGIVNILHSYFIEGKVVVDQV